MNRNVQEEKKIYSFCVENLLQYINITYDNLEKTCDILIDTGAQINIIKLSKIDVRLINDTVRHLICGITENTVSTLGVIILSL